MAAEQNSIKTPVKIGLPTLTVFTDRLHVDSILLKNGSESFPAVVVEYVSFTDRFGKLSKVDGIYIPPSGATHVIHCDIITPKEPYLAKSRIEISILTSTGIKYVVTFGCETHNNPKCTFVSSRTSLLTLDEQHFCDAVAKKHIGKTPDTTVVKCKEYDSDTLLEHYRKAVFTEMYYLKENGGHQYKASNGKFITKRNGEYAYHFELESELYLADDSPVTVTCSLGSSGGTVVLCEGFDILLLLEKDLGEHIGSAKINVEPWKLLEALNKRIESVKDLGPIALKFLHEGPQNSTKQAPKYIPKGQEIAKERALNSDITVIWGPPGTGKTHTMSEIAISLLQKGKSVLIVSHSNVSVDGVLAKTAELLREKGLEQYLIDGQVLRYGYVRDEKLSKDQFATAYNYALCKHSELAQQMEQLGKQKEKAISLHGIHSPETLVLESELKSLRKLLRLYEQGYAEKAKIIATTASKTYVDSMFKDKKYDVVMFDEVSMAYVPQIICAATFAKERFICVGDFRQLPPISQSKARAVLCKDVFSFLGISDDFGQIYAHPWLVMLNEQRRMHPEIASFANVSVYDNLLKNHESVHTNKEDIVKCGPFSGHSMNLVDLTGTYCATWKNSDNSRFNILSALVSFGTALEAEANGEESVAIITPYAAQTRLVRAMIQDHRKSSCANTSCATVHQFQGSERNVIIFDAVESYPSTKTGWLMSKNDNGSVTRLVNVAVTRAKGKLITVANQKYWETKFKETEHTFYKLLKQLKLSGNVVGTKDKLLQPYIAGLKSGKNIRLFTTREDACEVFENDIAKSRKCLLVSIPKTAKFGAFEEYILDIFKKAKANGTKLMIKAQNVGALPVAWSEYTWECDNAALPIVLVDNKVLWYGFPQATGTFVDGKVGFSTIFPLWIRFSGEHTVEMIKSLTALDVRSINNLEIPMSEKKAVKQGGIAAYVAKKEKCPKCGHSMMLSKTKSGKVNLLCSHCSNTELLTPASVNNYINTNSIGCPYCNNHIFCGLSYKGLYIKCSGGHSPKVEEI